MPSHDPLRPRKPRRSRSRQPAPSRAGSDEPDATALALACGTDNELSTQPVEDNEWRLVGNVEDWAPVLMSTNYADHLAIEDAAAAE